MYCYCLKGETEEEYHKKAKGTKKSVVSQSLTMANYKEVLRQEKKLFRTARTIRSKKHVLRTCVLRKCALSAFDDKRYVWEDQHSTSAFFNCRNK